METVVEADFEGNGTGRDLEANTLINEKVDAKIPTARKSKRIKQVQTIPKDVEDKIKVKEGNK